MRGFRRRLIAGIVATLCATFGLVASAGTASSAPTRAKTPMVKLSPADEQAMQALIDAHLKKSDKSVGGKQISINQIAYDDGKTILTFPLPGERQARAIDEPITPLGTANCSYYYACLYDGTWFDGARLSRSKCERVYLPYYNFGYITSSIHNNQTAGTQTVILNTYPQVLNANLAPSRVNDVGVGAANQAVYWQVC